jgi:hypothetical protein
MYRPAQECGEMAYAVAQLGGGCAIIYTDRSFQSWGVVRRLSSPGDGSAIWVDIKWMAGTKPTTGGLKANRAHSLTIDNYSRLEGKASWGPESGEFVQQGIPPSFGAYSREFPAGYPSSEYGF